MPTDPTLPTLSSVQKHGSSHLETLDGPYSGKQGMLPAMSQMKYNYAKQDKFALDKLNKNDPMASMDDLRR
jgi:hypothetical protein